MSTPRRKFLKSVAASLAVGVPALRALASSNAAIAASACKTVYAVYQGSFCGPRTGCPVGSTKTCQGIYYFYCLETGKYCWQEVANLGRCRG